MEICVTLWPTFATRSTLSFKFFRPHLIFHSFGPIRVHLYSQGGLSSQQKLVHPTQVHLPTQHQGQRDCVRSKQRDQFTLQQRKYWELLPLHRVQHHREHHPEQGKKRIPAHFIWYRGGTGNYGMSLLKPCAVQWAIAVSSWQKLWSFPVKHAVYPVLWWNNDADLCCAQFQILLLLRKTRNNKNSPPFYHCTPWHNLYNMFLKSVFREYLNAGTETKVLRTSASAFQTEEP